MLEGFGGVALGVPRAGDQELDSPLLEHTLTSLWVPTVFFLLSLCLDFS